VGDVGGRAACLPLLRLSGRLCTTRQPGLASLGASSSAGGGGALFACTSAKISGGNCCMYGYKIITTTQIISVHKTYICAPVGSILYSTSTVLGFDAHEFCDLAIGSQKPFTENTVHTYYCKARLSSRSLPTSASKIRTSPANALLKSLMYLQSPVSTITIKAKDSRDPLGISPVIGVGCASALGCHGGVCERRVEHGDGKAAEQCWFDFGPGNGRSSPSG
jgi:hypothetical protein